MSHQVSASQTDLVLQCPRPFEEDTEITQDDPGEPALWGRAFHEQLLNRMIDSGAMTPIAIQQAPTAKRTLLEILDRHRLPRHLKDELHTGTLAAAKKLSGFLGGDNPWKVKLRVIAAELPVAIFLDRQSGQATIREAKFDEAAHSYSLPESDAANEDPALWIGGTPDYVLADRLPNSGGGITIVLDVKTGDGRHADYVNPESLGQLLTLAAAFQANAVATLHAPRNSPHPSTIHPTDVTREELQAHVRRLCDAISIIGSGFMRTGPKCRWCPARDSCPTQIADRLQKTKALMIAAGGLVAPLKGDVDRGAFIEGSRKLEKLFDEARDEIKEAIRAGDVVESQGGKVFEIVARERRGISLKSIETALGRKRGADEIRRLEMLGCIVPIKYEELKAR